MPLRPWVREHLRQYLLSGGAIGHVHDTRPQGGSGLTNTLILRTLGRKTGKEYLTPLIYQALGDEFLIVGSLGGAPHHPDWYLNLVAHPETWFQVADRAFRGEWRVLEGAEREQAWQGVTAYFPTYAEYQQRTARQIPLILLTPSERLPRLTENAEWTAEPKDSVPSYPGA